MSNDPNLDPTDQNDSPEDPETANQVTEEEFIESSSGEIVPVGEVSGDEDANKIIHNHVLMAVGAGLIPIPLVDLASVTAIQIRAIKKLADLNGIDYSEGTARSLVAGLAGGAAARLGASVIKAIPGIGSAIGGLSMSALSGASTYAVCHVAQNHFVTKGTFLDMNMEDAKEAYAVALEKGKELVKTLEDKKDEAMARFEELRNLELENSESQAAEPESTEIPMDEKGEDEHLS